MVVRYATHIFEEEFFQKSILTALVPSLVAVARGITTQVVSRAKESSVIMIKPPIGIPARLLQVGRQVSPSEVFKELSNLSHYSTIFSINILQILFAIRV